MPTDAQLRDVYAHIERANSEMGHIQADVAEIKADIRWLKRFIPAMGILAAALVGIVEHLVGG